MLLIIAGAILIGHIAYGVWAARYILGGGYATDKRLDQVLGR